VPADRDRSDDQPARKGGVPVWVWLLLGGGLLFGMLLVVDVVVTLFATGVIGGPKLTVENVQRIKGGMTEAEVKAILGRPTEAVDGGPPGFAAGAQEFSKNVGGVDVRFQFGPTTPGLRTLTWRKGKEFITIVFRDGKVALVTDGWLKDGGRFGATK
jgi:hypothetical protein